MSLFDKFRRKNEDNDDARPLVESLINDFSGGASRRDAQEKLSLIGFCEEDSDYILDMIEMAYSRAATASLGVPLKNMRSNVDDDQFFKAALKIYLDKMPRQQT